MDGRMEDRPLSQKFPSKVSIIHRYIGIHHIYIMHPNVRLISFGKFAFQIIINTVHDLRYSSLLCVTTHNLFIEHTN